MGDTRELHFSKISMCRKCFFCNMLLAAGRRVVTVFLGRDSEAWEFWWNFMAHRRVKTDTIPLPPKKRLNDGVFKNEC